MSYGPSNADSSNFTSALSLHLQELQTALRSFVDARSWAQFHTPKNLAMALAGEVGELVEIFQWLTDEQSVAVAQSERDLNLVSNELADILIYVVRIADVLGIDMDDAVSSKLRMNEAKYPVDLSKGNAIKYSRRSET
jgi:dCTP diphosphatase